jgi:hypothetical protein
MLPAARRAPDDEGPVELLLLLLLRYIIYCCYEVPAVSTIAPVTHGTLLLQPAVKAVEKSRLLDERHSSGSSSSTHQAVRLSSTRGGHVRVGSMLKPSSCCSSNCTSAVGDSARHMSTTSTDQPSARRVPRRALASSGEEKEQR